MHEAGGPLSTIKPIKGDSDHLKLEVEEESPEGRELKQWTETDQAGFLRKIFSFGDVTFSFRGREELPEYPTLSKSRTTFLGEDSNWIVLDKFNAYKRVLDSTQNQQSANLHFVVDKSLLGVVELAIALGAKNEALIKIRDEILAGTYSDQALQMLDALIACNFSGTEQLDKKPDPNAEATVLMAILGDKEALQVVQKSLAVLEKSEQERIASLPKTNLERVENSSFPEIKPEQLCAVRVSAVAPERISEGVFQFHPIFDTTHSRLLRNTIHVTLNHHVANHSNGNWDGASYVLISPFPEMLQRNGLPECFSTVDTYWGMNPGTPLTFGSAVIVEAGGSDIAGISERSGDTVRYKSSNLTLSDLAIVHSEELQINGGDNILELRLNDKISEFFNYWIWDLDGATVEETNDRQRLYSIVSFAFSKYFSSDSEANSEAVDFSAENTTEQQKSTFTKLFSPIDGGLIPTVEEKVSEILHNYLDNENTDDPKPSEEDFTFMVMKTSEAIREFIAKEIKEIAVNATIREMGYSVEWGGKHQWGDGEGKYQGVNIQVARLAQNLGIAQIVHFYSAESDLLSLERDLFSTVSDVKQKGRDFPESVSDWTEIRDVDFTKIISQLNAKTKRALYVSGLISTRIK